MSNVKIRPPLVRRWGRWWLDTREPASLNIKFTSYYTYEIVLDRCRTEASRRLWIKHLSMKRFTTDRDMADLERVFKYLVDGGIIEDGGKDQK